MHHEDSTLHECLRSSTFSQKKTILIARKIGSAKMWSNRGKNALNASVMQSLECHFECVTRCRRPSHSPTSTCLLSICYNCIFSFLAVEKRNVCYFMQSLTTVNGPMRPPILRTERFIHYIHSMYVRSCCFFFSFFFVYLNCKVFYLVAVFCSSLVENLNKYHLE